MSNARRVSLSRVPVSAGAALAPAPRIDLSVCTACGLCVVVCPSSAVGIAFLGSGAWVPAVDEGRCTRCFDCESACLEQAIEVAFEIVEEERTPA